MKKALGTLLCLSTFLTVANASSFEKQNEFIDTVSIDKPINLEILITNDKVTCITLLKVLDSNNNIILDARDINMYLSQNKTFNAPIKEGTYTIKYIKGPNVECRKANFNLSYTKVLGNFEVEPNDDLSYATPLKELKYIHGYLQNLSDVDYYKLDLPTKGILDIEFLHKKLKSSANFSIKIIDENDKLVVEYDSKPDKLKTERKFGLNKGIYFIEIKKTNGGTGLEHHEYKMAYSFYKNENTEISPNDDFSNATEINDGVYISGTFNEKYKKDHYKYKAKKGKYSLLYEHKPFKYGTNIEIFDSNQKRIKHISQKGLKEKEYFDFEIEQDDTIYIRFEKSSLSNEENEELSYKFGVIKSK